MVPLSLILVCISKLRSGQEKYRFIHSFPTLSVSNLIVRHWLWNSSSARSCLYPIFLSSLLAIPWVPLYPALISTPDPLRGRRKPLLSLFSKLSFVFRIYRLLGLSISPENLERSRMLLIALRISLNISFVPSFSLLSSIVVLQANRYLLNFHFAYHSF